MGIKKTYRYPSPVKLARANSEREFKTLSPQSAWRAQELIEQGWEFLGGEFSPRGRTLRLVFGRKKV